MKYVLVVSGLVLQQSLHSVNPSEQVLEANFILGYIGCPMWEYKMANMTTLGIGDSRHKHSQGCRPASGRLVPERCQQLRECI